MASLLGEATIAFLTASVFFGALSTLRATTAGWSVNFLTAGVVCAALGAACLLAWCWVQP